MLMKYLLLVNFFQKNHFRLFERHWSFSSLPLQNLTISSQSRNVGFLFKLLRRQGRKSRKTCEVTAPRQTHSLMGVSPSPLALVMTFYADAEEQGTKC